jgi:hypothetical protein
MSLSHAQDCTGSDSSNQRTESGFWSGVLAFVLADRSRDLSYPDSWPDRPISDRIYCHRERTYRTHKERLLMAMMMNGCLY